MPTPHGHPVSSVVSRHGGSFPRRVLPRALRRHLRRRTAPPRRPVYPLTWPPPRRPLSPFPLESALPMGSPPRRLFFHLPLPPAQSSPNSRAPPTPAAQTAGLPSPSTTMSFPPLPLPPAAHTTFDASERISQIRIAKLHNGAPSPRLFYSMLL